MAFTYFVDDYWDNYVLNKYRTHKFDDNTFLVTTEHGSWVVLDKEEYGLLRWGRVMEKPELFKLLRSNGVLLAQENVGWVVDCFRRRMGFLFQGTTLHILTPSLRCNHNCVYCFAEAKPTKGHKYDMNEDTAEKVVDFIFQSPANAMTLEISGGEPLINFPIVQHIIEYSKELSRRLRKNIQYALVTNLTLMDEDILKYLMANKVRISTSLDGPKEVHDKNRRYLDGAGTYEDVVHWIDVIKNQHKYRGLGALPVITKHALSYPKEIVDEYLSHGFNILRLKYMMNTGYARRLWDRIGYSPDEYLRFWRESLDYILQLNEEGVNIKEGMSTLILKKMMSKDNPAYTDLNMPCGSAITQLVYTNNGDIYTCDEARAYDIFRLGNVREDNYAGILSSRTVLNMVDISSNLSTKCDDCVWKPYCGTCPVSGYASEGNLITKIPADFRCGVHGGMIKHLFRKLISGKEEERDTLLAWSKTPGF